MNEKEVDTERCHGVGSRPTVTENWQPKSSGQLVYPTKLENGWPLIQHFLTIYRNFVQKCTILQEDCKFQERTTN